MNEVNLVYLIIDPKGETVAVFKDRDKASSYAVSRAFERGVGFDYYTVDPWVVRER